MQVVDAGKCSPEQINAMIGVVSERQGKRGEREAESGADAGI